MGVDLGTLLSTAQCGSSGCGQDRPNGLVQA